MNGDDSHAPPTVEKAREAWGVLGLNKKNFVCHVMSAVMYLYRIFCARLPSVCADGCSWVLYFLFVKTVVTVGSKRLRQEEENRVWRSIGVFLTRSFR